MAGAERRRRRRRVVGLAVAVVLSTAAAGSFFSPVLDLDRLEVRGVEGPSQAEVRRAAGVSEGEALVAIDPAEVRARVERIDGVAHARVELKWPDRLVLTVATHRPVALLAVGDGRAGHVLTRAAEVVPVETVDGEGLRLVRLQGDPTQLGERERMALELLLGSLGPASERRLGALELVAGGSVRFAGADDLEGAVVELGELEDLPEKAQALEAMLGGLVDLRCLRRLDVSVPARVTVNRDPLCHAAARGDDR